MYIDNRKDDLNPKKFRQYSTKSALELQFECLNSED